LGYRFFIFHDKNKQHLFQLSSLKGLKQQLLIGINSQNTKTDVFNFNKFNIVNATGGKVGV
jgi:hypothetical protein